MRDPKKAVELTEQEKWECTARWLDALYVGYYHLLCGNIDADGFLEHVDAHCLRCPHYNKCPSNTKEPYRPTMPIFYNFHVLNRFIHGLSVLGPGIPPVDILDVGKDSRKA